MATNTKKVKGLQIPFKEFMPGQLIISSQFNDDMKDIEDKVNEIIEEHNVMSEEIDAHTDNTENPHQVNAHQVGTYDSGEIDEFVNDLRNGEFNDNVIENNVLADDCIDTRNYRDASITSSKVEPSFGSQLDISENIEIKTRYTKQETDELIKTKVGDGTYTKEELDTKFEEVQTGVIIDSTIGLEKLKPNVGNELDISRNVNITNRYKKDEVDYLIKTNALPRDWGSILEADIDESFQSKDTGVIPAADYMIADMFVSPTSTALEFDIKEVADSRNGYDSLNDRLNASDTKISSLESSVNEFKGEVEAAFLNTLEKVDTLEEISGSLDTQIKGINKQIFDNTNEVDSKIKKINTQLKQVDTSINNANTQISALTEKDANHEINLNKLGSRIDTTSSQLQQVKSDVETLKTKPSVPVEIVQQVNKNTEDNKRQDIMLSGLFNENADGRLSTEESGNDIKLTGSKQGLVDVMCEGNTLVNLWGVNNIQASGNCVINGNKVTYTSTENVWSNFFLKDSSLFKPSTDYTFIVNITKNTLERQNVINITSYASIGNTDIFEKQRHSGFIINGGVTGLKIQKLTTCSDFQDTSSAVRSFINNSTKAVGQQVELSIFIFEGDYTNKPIPAEYFEGMKSTFEDKLITQEMVDSGEELAENLGKYRVGVTVRGKNLFNKNKKLTLGKYYTNDGAIGGNGVLGDNNKNFIDETYYIINSPTLSWFSIGGVTMHPLSICFYDSSKSFIKRIEQTNIKNYEVPVNAKYFRLKGDYNRLNYLILNEGTVATQYEPFKEYNTSVYLNSPLLKGDEICVQDGKLGHLHNSSDEIDYNNLIYHTTYEGFKLYECLLPNVSNNLDNSKINIISDNFNCESYDNRFNNMRELKCYITKTKKLFIISNNKELNELKELVKNSKFIYQLAEPYFEKISDNKFMTEIPNNATLSIDSIIPCQSVKVSYTGNVPSVYGLEETGITNTNDIAATQTAVDFLLMSSMGEVMMMSFNENTRGGNNMGAYFASRIMKKALKYEDVIRKYPEFKEDIDFILRSEGYGDLIVEVQ